MTYDAQMARVIKAASSSGYVKRVAELIPQIHPELCIAPSDLDAVETELAVPGGLVVDLVTGELRQATREALHTKRTSVVPDLERDPMRWLRFLGEAFDHDQELISFFQECLGSALFIDSSPQAVVILKGPGGNGKSGVMDIVLRLLGDYTKSGQLELICASGEDQYRAASEVHNARLALLEELETKTVDTGALKASTGGGEVAVKVLYRDIFTTRMRATIFATSNVTPRFSRFDDGVERRLLILTMPHAIPEERKDVAFVPKLIEAEGSAILGWIVKGAMRYAAHGRNFSVIPKSVLQERRLIAQGANPLSFAVRESIERGETTDRLDVSSARKAVATVLAELLEKDLAATTVSPKQLSTELGEIFDAGTAVVHKSGPVRYYIGLRLKPKQVSA